jgi:hypothetical protein
LVQLQGEIDSCQDASVELSSEVAEGADDVGFTGPALAHTNDAIHVLLCVPLVDHVRKDVGGGPVVGDFLLRCCQLRLKLDDLLRLFKLNGSTELLNVVLTLYLDLLTTTLAAYLE